ncbi:HAD family hydrolase [Streptomyces sp. NPDC026589]|uniref:HAD family hydrolase n=1 Tax=Streptomyces sp. NPDC026589 TaxID=3155609 RepID=UPI0033C98024
MNGPGVDGRRVRGVVFDLDGTLVDSAAAHRAALRVALARFPGPGPAPSAARLRVAEGATDRATLVNLLGERGAEAALSVYQDALAAAWDSAPGGAMPGALRMVERLRASGLALGVCTGRSRSSAELLLRSAGIRLSLLVAREDAAREKPAPEGLTRAVALLGLRAAEAAFVGDTAADAAQGAAARVRTFVVTGEGVPPPGHALRLHRLADLPRQLGLHDPPPADRSAPSLPTLVRNTGTSKGE